MRDAPRPTLLDRVVRPFCDRRGPVWLAGLAALLCAPALGNGFQLDDHWLRARSLSPALARPAWLDLSARSKHHRARRGPLRDVMRAASRIARE
jgi:hypothetical protein